MRIIRLILGLFRSETINPAATVSLTLSSGYSADKCIPRVADLQLTDHFSLWELTVTLNASLQAENRNLSDYQVQKLTRLARFAEGIRKICGDLPVRIHSGYRSPALNGATLGSSKTSQHPICEAIDFDISGQSLDETFTKLRAEAVAGRLIFGQLIREMANRGNSIAEWVHISISSNNIAPEKIGQVLVMKAGEDGIPHYELVEKITFEPFPRI